MDSDTEGTQIVSLGVIRDLYSTLEVASDLVPVSDLAEAPPPPVVGCDGGAAERDDTLNTGFWFCSSSVNLHCEPWAMSPASRGLMCWNTKEMR